MKLFQLALAYALDGSLQTSTLTRISDNSVLVKTFTYTNGNLTSIARST